MDNIRNKQCNFIQGDSQALPFDDNTFDVVINECAVGIPDDSQRVLIEMVRVVKLGGAVAIHESTWMKEITDSEKIKLSERYGTTPLNRMEWIEMLKNAGVLILCQNMKSGQNLRNSGRTASIGRH